MNYNYDRFCVVCDQPVEDDSYPLVWKGIVFLDICDMLDCQEKFINFLEGEEE